MSSSMPRRAVLGLAALLILAVLAHWTGQAAAQTPNDGMPKPDYGYGVPPAANFKYVPQQQQPAPRTKTVTPGSQPDAPTLQPGDSLQVGKGDKEQLLIGKSDRPGLGGGL